VSTVRRRRIAATAFATTALLTLGACGTSFNAQTSKVYQAAVGADHRGELDVMNTLLVANDDGSATLSTSIVNNTKEPQELSSVSATTLGGEELQVTDPTKLALPSGVGTIVGGLASTSGFWITQGADAGHYVRLTLTFTNAAPVTIEAPVVNRTSEYDSVAEAPAPEPTPTPTDTDAAE
jgi:hypothetical protein